jgi:hypothetical protein
MGQAERLDARDAKERSCRDGADGSPGEGPMANLQFSDREISSDATGTA